MNQQPRLNLFALPSQTTLIFGGILIVIGLPLLMSLTGRFALLLPLLPLVVLIFTLWDFLAEPLRCKRRFAAQPIGCATGAGQNAGQDVDGQAEAWLVQYTAAAARNVGMEPVPILLKTTRPLRYPFGFGAWRQRYLMLPAWLIPRLYQQACDVNPQQARFGDVILHHELAHFANGDVALTIFARCLLRQTMLVVLAYWFALMWTPIMYQVGVRYVPEIAASLPPEVLAALPGSLQAQVLTILRNPPQQTWTMMVVIWLELSMAVLPLVGGAVFLWLRDLNLLLRVRELYADARADAWLGQLPPLIAKTHYWLRLNSVAAGQTPNTQTPNAQTADRRLFSGLRLARTPPLAWPGEQIGEMLRPDPQPKVSREMVMAQPQLAYGTVTEIGRRAGVIVLLLFLMLASLLAPAQKGIGSDIVLGLGFLVLATGLTPSAIVHLPDGRAVRRDRWRAIGFFMLVFNSALLAALVIAAAGILLRPGDLDLALYAIAGALPTSATPVIGDPIGYMVQVVAGSLLIYFVGAPLLLYGFLSLDFWIKQRVLHWYAATWLAQRSASVLLLVSGVLAALLWLGVAPLLHMIAFPLIIGFDWSMVGGIIGALLGAGAFAWWLWRNDRRYCNRCPHCGGAVEVSFQLGLRCQHCGEQLQPWLTARE